MKTRRIFAVIAAGVMLFSLSGCSLARADAAETEETDRLIGALVTTEYLDLFDMESYLRDNADQLVDGEEITLEGDSSYEGRLYATLTTRTYTDEATGESWEEEEYVFDTVTGWAFLSPALTDDEGERIGYALGGDDVFSDSHADISSTDDGDSLSMEVTLYVVADGEERSYYVNPVYQSNTGEVYAVSGDGFMTGASGATEGEIWSVTLDETTTTTTDGQSQTDQVSVTIHLAGLYSPQEIVLLQMDADSNILMRTAYTPGTLPETLELDSSCAYLLVETHKTDDAGQTLVSRELVTPEEDTLSAFYEEDGVCVRQWTELCWPE